MIPKIDIARQRFGRLVVQDKWTRVGARQFFWECVCDCGTVKSVAGHRLRSGWTKSCGCLHREVLQARNARHNLAHRVPEYGVWVGMKQRCHNPKNKKFSDYGGRGIRVCEQWQDDFALFFADMGSRPTPKHSIERLDNNGNYEPSNCKWATATEQASNRRPRSSRERLRA